MTDPVILSYALMQHHVTATSFLNLNRHDNKKRKGSGKVVVTDTKTLTLTACELSVSDQRPVILFSENDKKKLNKSNYRITTSNNCESQQPRAIGPHH